MGLSSVLAGWLALAAAGEGLPAERFDCRVAGRNEGVDLVYRGRVLVPLRLGTNGTLRAEHVQAGPRALEFTGLRCKDPRAVAFDREDFVRVEREPGAEPVVRFRLTIRSFDAARWKALFPDSPAPWHFLSCALPTARVWHQRGWLNATPLADPFPLLDDFHVGAPELSCKWNRNWGYICPLGAHPIPMIGLWDPEGRLYLGYDFQGARAADQSERFVATAYCWRQDQAHNFITLAYPFGGDRYGELVYPKPGDRVESWFHLIVDPDLPPTEDPNERFQARLFGRYRDQLPQVPETSDLGWVPGAARMNDFAVPIGLGLFGPGGEGTFYPPATVLINGWGGHLELPLAAAVRRDGAKAAEAVRERIDLLLGKYAKHLTVGGEPCLFWEKPLSGQWRHDWGGPGVTTLHNTDAWFPARVLVELCRYDRQHGQASEEYLQAVDQIYNWTRHFVWTRNEFADVPSSPFAIGGTLSTAFLLDYYFAFRSDPARAARAEDALRLADRVAWRYLPIWAMDSDRYDDALDGSFLIEPNSGRDWAGLACANEVHWVVDSTAQVYVHTGDRRLRWYLRGILDRWPQLYQPEYRKSLAECGSGSMTEGLGLFDGAGPGRGGRYAFGTSDRLAVLEPVGESKLRVLAGTRAVLTCCRGGARSDVIDYRTDGNGACSFRIQSSLAEPLDVSFTYPLVDVSGLAVHVTRQGETRRLGPDSVRRPEAALSSLYLRQLRSGDLVQIGHVPPGAKVIDCAVPAPARSMPIQVVGDFFTAPVARQTRLVSDWGDLESFAGLSPGVRWTCGIPFRVSGAAASRPFSLHASASVNLPMFVAYAPPLADLLANRPALILDNGQRLPLSGKPVLAWRAWPPMFQRMILLDRAEIPADRELTAVDPAGTLVVAVTAWRGTPPNRPGAMAAIDAAYAQGARRCGELLPQLAELAALRKQFAALGQGKIAILPPVSGGPAPAFLQAAGVAAQAVTLSPDQLVDPAFFSARRFPVAIYTAGEEYWRSVHRDGDGKEAVRRYLAGGGTLVLLSSGPFPFFYGLDAQGGRQVEPLLPELGVPLGGPESAPPGLAFLRQGGQKILGRVPPRFEFNGGDGRIRAVLRDQVAKADRYLPLLAAVDAQGRDYGDVAFWIELRTGPAAGGRILYFWHWLSTSPQAAAIQHDLLDWLLDRMRGK
jgi:hypothetical protein